jgi:hypothetical protein
MKVKIEYHVSLCNMQKEPFIVYQKEDGLMNFFSKWQECGRLQTREEAIDHALSRREKVTMVGLFCVNDDTKEITRMPYCFTNHSIDSFSDNRREIEFGDDFKQTNQHKAGFK